MGVWVVKTLSKTPTNVIARTTEVAIVQVVSVNVGGANTGTGTVITTFCIPNSPTANAVAQFKL